MGAYYFLCRQSGSGGDVCIAQVTTPEVDDHLKVDEFTDSSSDHASKFLVSAMPAEKNAYAD